MLGATMALIYMRDKMMTKRTCDVGSHGGMFQVAPEYWRTKQVHERKPVLPDTVTNPFFDAYLWTPAM